MDQEHSLVFQRRLARMQALLEATRKVHSTIKLDDVLEQVVKISVRELEVPGAGIVPADGPAEKTSIPTKSYGDFIPPAESGDRAADDLLNYPLKTKDGKRVADLGVRLGPGRKLEIDEQDFLEGLALQASVAIENARFYEDSLRWARLDRDLQTARAIQQSLIPKEMPEICGYSLGAKSEACYEVGGDYLDIVPSPGGGYLLVVADVAGKGLSSALIGTSMRAAVRAMHGAGVPLSEMAAKLNDTHYQDGEEARMKYLTAAFIHLDPERHIFEVVSAGHTPSLLVQPGGRVEVFKSCGTPLGLLPSRSYPPQSAIFPAGSTLFLYTDGITEASRAEEEFGEERLAELLVESSGSSPNEIIEKLWLTLADFEDGEGPCDDKTVLAVRREPE